MKRMILKRKRGGQMAAALLVVAIVLLSGCTGQGPPAGQATGDAWTAKAAIAGQYSNNADTRLNGYWMVSGIAKIAQDLNNELLSNLGTLGASFTPATEGIMNAFQIGQTAGVTGKTIDTTINMGAAITVMREAASGCGDLRSAMSEISSTYAAKQMPCKEKLTSAKTMAQCYAQKAREPATKAAMVVPDDRAVNILANLLDSNAKFLAQEESSATTCVTPVTTTQAPTAVVTTAAPTPVITTAAPTAIATTPAVSTACKIDVTDGSKADWDACGIAQIANGVRLAASGDNILVLIESPSAIGSWGACIFSIKKTDRATKCISAGCNPQKCASDIGENVAGSVFGEKNAEFIIVNRYSWAVNNCKNLGIAVNGEFLYEGAFDWSTVPVVS